MRPRNKKLTPLTPPTPQLTIHRTYENKSHLTESGSSQTHKITISSLKGYDIFVGRYCFTEGKEVIELGYSVHVTPEKSLPHSIFRLSFDIPILKYGESGVFARKSVKDVDCLSDEELEEMILNKLYENTLEKAEVLLEIAKAADALLTDP